MGAGLTEENPATNLLFPSDRKREASNDPGKSTRSRGKQALQLANIFDTLPEAMIITDQDGRIQQVNRAAIALLGEPEPGLELRDWPRYFGLFANEDLASLEFESLSGLQSMEHEGGPARELVLRREPGDRLRWLSMSVRSLPDTEGSVEGAWILLQDITPRKSIELSRETYVKRIETLYRLSHLLSEGGSDSKRITRSVASLVSEVIGDLSLLLLLSPNGKKLNLAAHHDTNPAARSLFRKALERLGTEFPADQGHAGTVVGTGKPVLIPDVPPEELGKLAIPEFQEYVQQVGISSSLMVPMIGRGGVIGVLSLGRHRGHKPYSAGDQSFLLDIAARTALALENGRLVESLRSEISERLSAERALGMSEERFRSIFESTTLGIKILDPGGNLLHTNRAYQDMLGYSQAEMVGRHFHDFLHPEDRARGQRLFHDLKINGLPDFRLEHRALAKDGSLVWMKTTFSGVKKGNGEEGLAFIVGIVENITGQKRLQTEMAELNNRLQNGMELERLRLAQELHDGPMQELYNAIYRLEELRIKVDPELGQELEQVNRDVQTVLGELRSTAKRLRPPTISSFGLEKAIRSHVEDFREKYPAIGITTSLAQDGQMLPEEIRLALFRILQQSLMNVVRHAGATEVSVRFAFDAEEASLEIRDNGRGFKVPENWIELVRAGHYGLAGAAERVNALSGSFRVESEPGKSTLIRAVIPWQKNPTEPDGVRQ